MTLNEMKATLYMVQKRYESDPKSVEEWRAIERALGQLHRSAKAYRQSYEPSRGAERRTADRIDGYDRDDLGDSGDY